MLRGISEPNNAKLGTVCMILAKPNTGVLRFGLRVNKIPSGTPITMAIPMEMITRKTCTMIKSESSRWLPSRNWRRFTKDPRPAEENENTQRSLVLQDRSTVNDHQTVPNGAFEALVINRSQTQ